MWCLTRYVLHSVPMSRTTHRLSTLAVAVAGVLAGHAFAFSSPAAHHHADGTAHLHDAVHGYLPAVAAVAVPLGFVALLAMVVGELRGRRPRIDLAGLLVLQASLFLGQESIERLVAGGSPGGILLDPVLWVGLGAQFFVAGAILATIRGVAHVARTSAWARTPRGRIATLGRSALISIPAGAPSMWLTSATSTRGPPALA